ncbi:MAG: Flp pilus assembly protein CpaB [Acidobacteriota bacterium]|nr:Flp pilus assembly protein CpaB [Acidobacteriota bacterium]
MPRRGARRPGRDDDPPVGLAAVAPERLTVRLRLDGDGGPPRQQRRRLLQPLPLAAAFLILLALIGYWSVYQQTGRRSQILIAARTLPAGHTLRAGDLATAKLGGDAQVLATLIPVSERASLVGRSLKTTVAAGAPLPQAALAATGRGVDAFTLAVPLLHALAGSLAPGDRVTVLATYTSASGQTLTRPVVRNLEVLAVGAASGFDAASQTIPVTVALPDPAEASALALADEAGKLDLLREAGGGASAPIPAATAPASAP